MGRLGLGSDWRETKWKLWPANQTWGLPGYRRSRVVLMVVVAITLVVWMFHPKRHACTNYSFVPADQILDDVITLPIAGRDLGSRESLPLCGFNNGDDLPSLPQRPWTITSEDLDLLTSRFDISPGGHGLPTAACQPQVRVAVVVPYRDRPEQLNAFLWYMHHFLSMQYLDYTIIIVEQSSKLPFNRAKLFNVGFSETLLLDDRINCFIFHDVDLLPENLLNVYGCSSQPRHLITSLNTFRYTLQACGSFGGAVAMTREQYQKVNGCANRFFGWGGEDDEFRRRVHSHNYSITRWDPSVARYTMMIHKKEAPNANRMALLEDVEDYLETDGLLTLSYKRVELQKLRLYTRIVVDL